MDLVAGVGESLAFWARWFPAAEVVGVDLLPGRAAASFLEGSPGAAPTIAGGPSPFKTDKTPRIRSNTLRTS